MDRLIKALQEVVLEEGETEVFSKWKELDAVRRKEGEDVRTFVN